MPRTLATGVWKTDSIRDVAESLGIVNLQDDVAQALAGDVEYRLWEVIEESIKHMQHAKRTKLSVADVASALKVRNIEPLWGFTPASSGSSAFRKVVTPTGVVYAPEDEEIDLKRTLRSRLGPSPRQPSLTAHWLAIEGVQPTIKENPSPAELARYNQRSAAPHSLPHPANPNATITPLVKHVLSRELQLYFTRLTESVSSSSTEMREAALSSLRDDPGLHQLVPYLVSWGGEQISAQLGDLGVLDRILDMYGALLDNQHIFIEPYLHQLVPPILTCILTSSLPQAASSPTMPTPSEVRSLAAELLATILNRFGTAYPSLRPRIVKTLLQGLGGADRGLGPRSGAARALIEITSPDKGGGGGGRTLRGWVGGGLKRLGAILEAEEESEEYDVGEVVEQVLNVLQQTLESSEESTVSLEPEDAEEHFGPLFGAAMAARWTTRDGKEIAESIVTLLETEDGQEIAHAAMEEDASS